MRIHHTASALAIAAALTALPGGAHAGSAQSDQNQSEQVQASQVQAGAVIALNAGADAVKGGAQEDTQSEPAPTEADDSADMIVVLGARLIGQVQAPAPPILELDETEIAAYGAGSIAELLQALGPQVNSGRGRGGGGPVILVNGVRISSFRELRSYPPEAIQRTEVFSEEVAQRYGFSANQRVVNFILKDNFSSREIEVEYQQPWDGGFSQQEAQATYLRIDGPSRLNLNLEWNNSSLLTEGERGVVQAEGSLPDLASDPDPADFRSLVSDSAGIEATGNWTTRLGETGNSLSVNATYERDDSLRLQGLESVQLTDPDGTSVLRTFNPDDPLQIDRRDETYALGSTLNLGVGDWQVTGTLDASRAESTSRIASRVDTSSLVEAAAAGDLALDADLDPLVGEAGFDLAESRTDRAGALLTARGNPVYLPAGEVSVTFDAGYDWNRIRSEDTRNPGLVTDLDRGDLTAGVNLGVPLTARDEFLGGIGDITLNLSAGFNDLSDFGTLYDWSAGVTWNLTDTLTLNANHINRETAPSLAQLGNPEIATDNVPVFDLTNNETVLVTLITGGNPNLPAQSQSDWQVGLNWQLPVLDRANFTFEYIRNSSDNVATGFPTLTPAIEAAFPDRITRDETGRLTQIDQRAITLARQDVERLQFGLNLSGQIAGMEDEAGGNGQGGDQRRGGGGGGFGGPPPGAGGPPGGFQGNPEAFAAMRAQFCAADPAQLLDLMNATLAAQAAGEPLPNGPDGTPLAIPPQMLERLAGEDGRIDAERFGMMRDRICSGDGPPQGGERGGGGPGGGGPRMGRFGPGGGSGGRWFVNFQYSLELQNEVLIAPGVPTLDLLDGDALTGGGQPRHTFNLRSGVFKNGYGVLAFATYTGESRLDGTGEPGSTDLTFSDLLTVNLRMFADLGRRESLVAAVPLLDNVRVGLGMNNLFDARQRVTDSNGEVPLRFQPFLIDPVGRSFELEIRKLF